MKEDSTLAVVLGAQSPSTPVNFWTRFFTTILCTLECLSNMVSSLYIIKSQLILLVTGSVTNWGDQGSKDQSGYMRHSRFISGVVTQKPELDFLFCSFQLYVGLIIRLSPYLFNPQFLYLKNMMTKDRSPPIPGVLRVS